MALSLLKLLASVVAAYSNNFHTILICNLYPTSNNTEFRFNPIPWEV